MVLRAKTPRRAWDLAGSIVLLDDAPHTRAARAEHLVRAGFQVKLAASVQEAESLWQPNTYALVLVAVTKDIHEAAELCNRIKGTWPQQIVGLLVPATAELPPTHCPDLIWPEEELDYFLARVRTLAHFSSAA